MARAPLSFVLSIFCLRLFAAGIDVTLIEKQDKLRQEIENKINHNILDPIFGKNRGFAFADIELEFVARKAEQQKEGIGVLQEYKEKGAADEQAETDFLLPGIPRPRSILNKENKRPEAAHGTQKQQSKAAEEIRYGVDTEITNFQVTVIHDDTISPESIQLARERINDFLLPYKVMKKDPPVVIFKPTRFKSLNIYDDFKKPSVYLPLLYALLFLLLLLFLFGPLWSFFRKYIKALMAKPGAEVNIEDRRGEGGNEGEGQEEQKQEGHQQIDMNFLQKEEEKTEEEDESMKKFEPFTYINEENLKRLVYLFLIRKEDPWVIAIVLSYIRPELARQALSMLPVELQSRVALESLSVRQASREQIEAIDRDIKENVDYVMGGIEQLSKMLEDADAQTRKNIMEYLKTQKPEIYEKIKRVVLTFDDLVSFSDRDIQTVIRSVSSEDVARAIKNADPVMQDKFFKNMSQGAANAIKEIMEYSGEVSIQQADEAQMRILDAVKTLEAEGKISSYKHNNDGVYIVDIGDSTMEEERRKRFEKLGIKEAEKMSRSDAAEYVQAGIDYFNQNDFENAIQYLNYAVSLDPENVGAWHYLGSALYSVGRTAESVAAYENYVRLSGDNQTGEWVNQIKKRLGL